MELSEPVGTAIARYDKSNELFKLELDKKISLIPH